MHLKYASVKFKGRVQRF